MSEAQEEAAWIMRLFAEINEGTDPRAALEWMQSPGSRQVASRVLGKALANARSRMTREARHRAVISGTAPETRQA